MDLHKGWDSMTAGPRVQILAASRKMSALRQRYLVTEWKRLPFYSDVRLARLTDPYQENFRQVSYYLIAPHREPERLNGAGYPVYFTNELAPLQLNQSNACAYLKFFGFFVRGDEGPFLMVESLSDCFLFQEPNSETCSLLERAVRPIRLEGRDGDNYLLNAVVFYSNVLFEACFAVQPDGRVEMIDDQPIVGNMRVRAFAPI